MMFNLKSVPLILAFSAIYYCEAINKQLGQDEPLIETKTGIVVGNYETISNKTIAKFFGIPYAQPPLGKKRFAKPEPVKPWDDKLLATKLPPACMQYSSRNFEWIPLKLNKSEDCLYLNIWSPMKYNDDSILDKLPVLVWIYGGGFSSGASGMDIYDGGVMASVGNVIVVSINFRVGIFGFLYGGSIDAPGNVELHDQLLGLKWVNENIQYFGGDPKRITLFGESAGSVAVAAHIISPLSKGLFQKAILESGTSLMPMMFEDTEASLDKANHFAERVGCSNEKVNIWNNSADVLDCLQQKDPLELAKVENIFTSKFPVHFIPVFGSTCNGCSTFLPKSPKELLRLNNFKQIPVILGINGNEGAILMNYAMPDIFPLNANPNVTINIIKSAIKKIFPVPDDMQQQIFEHYIGEIPQNDSSTQVQRLTNAFSDYLFDCPGLVFAENLNYAYFYLFTDHSPKDKNAEWVGATHFKEIPYVFGHPILDSQKYTDQDENFSLYLIKQWTEFARDGYPSVEDDNNEKWSKFDSTNPMVYDLNDSRKNGMVTFPRKTDCEFWRSYITD